MPSPLLWMPKGPLDSTASYLQVCISDGLLVMFSDCPAPALQPGSPIPRVKLTLGRLFARITPRLTISAGLDVNNISRLKQEVDDFLADPLCTTKISLQTGSVGTQSVPSNGSS